MVNLQGRKKSIEAKRVAMQMLGFAGKYFEAAIMSMVSDIKENVLTMNKKIRNFSREIEI
jgi:hypothetical protein